MESLRPIIICDIDGTIALRGDRDPHEHDSSMEDGVNWSVVKLVDALHDSRKFDIVLMSGRDEKFREVTEYWLYAHNLMPYRLELVMRPRGDNREDSVVKQELFEKHPFLKRRTWAVIDDRQRVVDMWRAIGLTCLQVAPGNF